MVNNSLIPHYYSVKYYTNSAGWQTQISICSDVVRRVRSWNEAATALVGTMCWGDGCSNEAIFN